MINFKTGDMFFEPKTDAIVCPTNIVGVMGKGAALGVKRRFPVVFTRYKEDYLSRDLAIGKVVAYPTYQEHPRVVICLHTKKHWRDTSKIEYVEDGLIDLVRFLRLNYQVSKLKKIVIPQLGCGCGGLSWDQVKKIMVKHLNDLPKSLEVCIYAY